jgi:hypothetical protein
MISEDHQLTVDYHCASLSLINRTFHFICIIGILLVNIDLSYGQFLNFPQLELNRDLTIFTKFCISIGFFMKQSPSNFGNNFLNSLMYSSYAVIKQTGVLLLCF